MLRQAFEGPTVDPEVRAVFNRALDDLRRAGATVLDTVHDRRARFDPRGRTAAACNPFKYEINHWLAEQGDRTFR